MTTEQKEKIEFHQNRILNFTFRLNFIPEEPDPDFIKWHIKNSKKRIKEILKEK